MGLYQYVIIILGNAGKGSACMAEIKWNFRLIKIIDCIVICNLYVSINRMLWFMTSFFRGTFKKMTFNQARLSFASVVWPAHHPWLVWVGFVQPPVYKISPHSWLTSGTTWWSGVPGRERLTRQHHLKITSQLSACETSWVNMPLPLEYLNLQVTISIKILLFETISSNKMYFATFRLIWLMYQC